MRSERPVQVLHHRQAVPIRGLLGIVHYALSALELSELFAGWMISANASEMSRVALYSLEATECGVPKGKEGERRHRLVPYGRKRPYWTKFGTTFPSSNPVQIQSKTERCPPTDLSSLGPRGTPALPIHRRQRRHWKVAIYRGPHRAVRKQRHVASSASNSDVGDCSRTDWRHRDPLGV